MSFDQTARQAMLRERADDYVRVALECITRQYPVYPMYIETGPGPFPSHREFHPAFYGSFDWHSCVEMHWVIVRLLRLFPDATPGQEARATLNELLTPEHIATEVAFFSDPNHRGIERPYGWGWLLTLMHELTIWDDPDGRRWANAVSPLADQLATMMAEWLPRMTYSQRSGVHSNSAFGLACSYDVAMAQADRGDRRLLDAINEASRRWFAEDVDYPGQYEPSGSDFLSAALCEAVLMSRVLEPGRFLPWFDRFLPELAERQPAALFTPAVVSDNTDGQIAHLHGLNLSRSWAFTVLADQLPSGDRRIEPMMDAAERHSEASLPAVTGGHYMTEHWLAVYAALLLGRDRATAI